NPVAPIGTAELARASYPGDWYEVVTEGRIDRYMPPFQSLTERQRWDAIAYVYTLSAPAETVAVGQERFQANCASCHGETGLGDGPDAVNYADGISSFSDQFLMSERSKTDLYNGMAHPDLADIPDVVSNLSEDDRWAITDYLRTLTFVGAEEEVASANPLATVGAEGENAPETGTTTAPADTTGQEEPLPAGQGVVSGQVVNLSGGEVPVGQEVVLHGFDQFQEVISTTAQVDADGFFQFEGIEVPEGRAFIISVDYKNTTYTSDLAVVEAGITTYDMPVSIYETTTEISGLSIQRLHVLFEFIAEDQVRVAELIIISNLSNRVVVPDSGDSALLTYTLPEGATNLQFQEGALGRDFIETPNGFGDLRAIMPGEGRHQVLFSYDMPYAQSLEIAQPLTLPVESLVVLSPDVGVSVTGEGLESGGVQDVDGVSYEMFTGGSIPAGETLAISLSGKPDLGGAAVVSTGSSSNMALGLGTLGVALLGVGFWLFRRANQKTSVQEVSGENEEDLSVEEMDADSLMDAIIALDDHFKDGGLPEDAYLRRRAVLKEQLRKELGQ
ncbi:MAG TPA: cytochrome c, partial [Anaerolineales bacterium]|nr:cytochrome c [Anaerolineales bacterium]